jgi:hypothetical protein
MRIPVLLCIVRPTDTIGRTLSRAASRRLHIMRYTLLVLLFALTDAAWGVAGSGPAGPAPREITR